MPTTITVSEKTRRRLAGYKRGGMTYDDVLNHLMDEVPIEDVTAEQLEEHYRALEEDEWITADEFRKRLEAMLAKRGRRGRSKPVPGRGQPQSPSPARAGTPARGPRRRKSGG